jgi:septal ring factor EnvC (AmiA/AmiB activator)
MHLRASTSNDGGMTMTDTVIVTAPDPDRDTELRTEIAFLDLEIVEKQREIERLQNEIHDLEIKQGNLFNELKSLED